MDLITLALAKAYTDSKSGNGVLEDPVITGTFSMNRKEDSVVGSYSYAEGFDVTASGPYSHAEGYKTTASEYASHAEGYNTKAIHQYAHAEGYNTEASNYGAHAEGYRSIASGDCSHSEGYQATASAPSAHAEGCDTISSGSHSHAEGYKTTASGSSSHAEGYTSVASGHYSHAEGYNSTALGDYSHVQGRINIEDADGLYAHIVGNGERVRDGRNYKLYPSNAHTLDWSGNAWFQGEVYVGGAGQHDENAVRLAKMTDIPDVSNFVTGDDVSEQISDAISDISSGVGTIVQANWSENNNDAPGYVANRTHWEEYSETNIFYDGNAWDKYFIYDEADQLALVKVSDYLPTIKELENATVVVTRNAGKPDETTTTEKLSVMDEESTDIVTGCINVALDAPILVVREPNHKHSGYTFRDAGIYVMVTSNSYVSKIHIPGIIHKLDGKYLPEGTPWVETVEGTVILSEAAIGNNGGVMQLDNLIGLTEGERYRITYKGMTYESVCKSSEIVYEGQPSFGYYVGNGSLFDYMTGSSYGLENTGEPFLILDFLNAKYTSDTCIAVNQTILAVMNAHVDDTISVTHIEKKVHETSYEYFDSRTHWAEKVDVPLDIRFDRSKMLYYYCPYGGGLPQTWVHISDQVITLDELTDCSLQLADGSVVALGGVVKEATDYGTTFEITSGDYAEYAVRIVDNPSALAPDAKPGVYFKVETSQPEKQIIRMYSTYVTMPGVKYHKLPAEYAPEIPLFDLIEMGMPAVPLDFTDSGNATQLTGVDFTAFEDAIKRGAVRVRYAVDIGGGDPRIMTSMIMPTFDEVTNVWQFAAIGVTYDGVKFTSLRVALMYFVNHATMYGHCAIIPHGTIG